MSFRRFAPVAVLVLTVTATGVLLASGPEDPERRGVAPRTVNPTWRTECGACHVAYPPALLPARSWEKLMSGLADHFGEDASLDAATAREIAAYLVRESGDRGAGRAGRKAARAVAPGETPLRITGTRWFRHEHDEIAPGVWRRAAIGSAANCGACHEGAAEGDFSERRVAVPREDRTAAHAAGSQ
ncbi:MAG: cytochrome C [Burkholderiales bacterium]|nr:cytochrome C [Burkholderiales bacterium]